MSQQNVELVRRGYDAFNRGDMNAAFELFDPEIEWSEGTDVPEPQLYHGHDGVRRQQQRFRESWESFSIEPEEFIEAGDRLVVIVKLAGRGKGSGIDVETRGAHVWTVRAGKAVRLEMYLDTATALEAVGLSE
jgi:ketosteroid isomerase-like protein